MKAMHVLLFAAVMLIIPAIILCNERKVIREFESFATARETSFFYDYRIMDSELVVKVKIPSLLN